MILGAWFQEDQDVQALTTFMEGRSHRVEGTESVFNINLFREVHAMRWTYFDVPATQDGLMPFELDDVTLDGVGRFNDTRGIASTNDIADSWTGSVSMDVAYTHYHNEKTALDFQGKQPEDRAEVNHGSWLTKQDSGYSVLANTSNSLTVYRRSPNTQFQTQVFQTRDQAHEAYDEKAGEVFWYTDTLKNNLLDRNDTTHTNETTAGEGELYDAVFYERLPLDYLKTAVKAAGFDGDDNEDITAAYLETALNDGNIVWRDRNGKDVTADRTRGLKLKVTQVYEQTEADFGGSMNYVSEAEGICNYGGEDNPCTQGGSNTYTWGKTYSDMTPTDPGVSNDTRFGLFRIEWVVDPQYKDDTDRDVIYDPSESRFLPNNELNTGSDIKDNIALRPTDRPDYDSTCMEVGDTLSITFPVRAAQKNLPQVYKDLNASSTVATNADGSKNTTGLKPAYLPRFGEFYYSLYHLHCGHPGCVAGGMFTNPAVGSAGFTLGGPIQDTNLVQTQNVVMDMDSLIHEAAFTADKPKHVDTYDMLKNTTTFIPGTANNTKSNGAISEGESNAVRLVNTYDYGTSGSNGKYLDFDIRTGYGVQKVTYLLTGAKTGFANLADLKTKLPNRYSYVTPYATTLSSNDSTDSHYWTRDYFAFVSGPRFADAIDVQATGETTEAGVPVVESKAVAEKRNEVENTERTSAVSSTPLVWSQTRVHMAKAWLATSSEMVSDFDSRYGAANAQDDYQAGRRYSAPTTMVSGSRGSATLFKSYAPADVNFVDYHKRSTIIAGFGDNVATWAFNQPEIEFGQYEAALEYAQEYSSRLVAYNYGDRNLDGVEFTYIMPRGVEPVLDEDNNVVLTAQLLKSVNGYSSGRGSNANDGAPYVDETYSDIKPEQVEVEILQTPYGDYRGYDAPSENQDPAVYRTGNVMKAAIDYSADVTTSTYTPKGANGTEKYQADGKTIVADPDQMVGESYVRSSQPWVLKITVKQDLGKWYGRAIDGNARDFTDPDPVSMNDCYVKGGYKIRVDVRSHIFGNNEDEAWYDRLLTTPWDDTTSIDFANGQAKVGTEEVVEEVDGEKIVTAPATDDKEPFNSSSYYQIFDLDNYEGNAALPSRRQNVQPYGMDYSWTLIKRDRAGVHAPLYGMFYGSPNMPAVKGWTVLNNTVTQSTSAFPEGTLSKAQTDLAKMGLRISDGSQVNFADALKDEKPIYAETGTHAIQRKPFVRTWNTVSEFVEGVDEDTASDKRTSDAVKAVNKTYFVDTESDARQLNVHVENRDWLADQPYTWYDLDYDRGYKSGTGYYSTQPNTAYATSEYTNNYSVDGGQKGTLALPMVTVVLPYGVAPYSRTTRFPYTGNGTTVEISAQDWDISSVVGADASNYTNLNNAVTPTEATGYTTLNSVNDNLSNEWKTANFKVTSTYELVSTDTGANEYRYVVRFEPKSTGFNEKTDLITSIVNNGLATFKLNIVTYDEPKGLDGEASYRAYDNIRTYVTSKVPGYKFLTDQDVTVKQGPSATAVQNPFYVGSKAVLTPYHNSDSQRYSYGPTSDVRKSVFGGYVNKKIGGANVLNSARNGDLRLDATSGAYTEYYTASSNGSSWKASRSSALNTLVGNNSINSGAATAEKVPTNYLIGFNGRYVEEEGTVRVASLGGETFTGTLPLYGSTSGLVKNGKGLLVGDYDLHRYGLSDTTTKHLNLNTITGTNKQIENATTEGTAVKELFVSRSRQLAAAEGETVEGIEHKDAGVYTATKLRVRQPTLQVSYEVEANPTDRPVDQWSSKNPATTEDGTSYTGAGASRGMIINTDGSIVTAVLPKSLGSSNGVTTSQRVRQKLSTNHQVLIEVTETTARTNATGAVTVTTDLYEYTDTGSNTRGTKVLEAHRVDNRATGVITISAIYYDKNTGAQDWRITRTYRTEAGTLTAADGSAQRIYTSYTTKLYNQINGVEKIVADESYDSRIPNGDGFRTEESTTIYRYDESGTGTPETRNSESIGRIYRLNPDLGWHYQSDVFDVFGMLNDWVTHETIFNLTDEHEAWQYSETPWFSTTIRNHTDTSDEARKGAMKHGKLVFSMHLPEQVTFFDGQLLTDDKALAEEDDHYRWIGDYEDNDYNFYVEHRYIPRGQTELVTEKLTPKDLILRGWEVKITSQPDYGDNRFATDKSDTKNINYAKADPDDPLDTPLYRNDLAVKSHGHDSEIVVFELAPPDDATDEEYQTYDSLVRATYSGVHPNGYIGYEDSVTLKIRTRVDNMGPEATAIDASMIDESNSVTGPDGSIDSSLVSLINVAEQMKKIAAWNGNGSTAYATAHQNDLGWIENSSEVGWRHLYKQGSIIPEGVDAGMTEDKVPIAVGEITQPTVAWKGKVEADQTHRAGVGFKNQSLTRFYREGNTTEDANTALAKRDYDNDGVYDDLYVYAESGSFRLRKPSAVVRGDTAKYREGFVNGDMGIDGGEDASYKGQNDFYITEAVNTGGAVNSFIVDWQVPFWATKKTSVYDAPFESETERVARVASVLDQVSSGVWEVPGSSYTATYTYKGTPIAFTGENNTYTVPGGGTKLDDGTYADAVYHLDTFGNVVDEKGVLAGSDFEVTRTAVGSNEANEIESKLRVFMYARIASDDTSVWGNGYDEQNNAEYTDHENFAMAGSDADRDYFYGEDDTDWFGDSTDANSADDANAHWIQIGDPNGYAVSEKKNVSLSAKSFMNAHPGYEVRQIRWVIKAVPRKADGSYDATDDSLAYDVPVPHGFRLNVDALEDDPAVKETQGIQEADEIDPRRMNVGWKLATNLDGTVAKDSKGNYILESGYSVPTSVTNNAPMLRFNTTVITEPTMGQASAYPDKHDPQDNCSPSDPDYLENHKWKALEDSIRKEEANNVHINHFVSATPRYDDTKHVSYQRDRAGFYRTDEEPVLALEITSGYFSGTGTTGFSWEQSQKTINRATSLMMRYKIVLTNLSEEQMTANGYAGYEEDVCTNPQISTMLTYIEGLGAAKSLRNTVAAGDLEHRPFQYVDYDTLTNSIASGSDEYSYFDWGFTTTTSINPITGRTIPAANINNKTPLWTYYVADSDLYLHPQSVTERQGMTVPQLLNPLVNTDNADLKVEDKMGSADEELKFDRKFMSWHFTGAKDNNNAITRGILYPGESMVVELLVPLDSQFDDTLPAQLLSTTGYGYKPGNYNGFLPNTTEDGVRRARESDTRDANLDGQADQLHLLMSLPPLEFAGAAAVNQTKTSSSLLETQAMRDINGPAAVPEGSTYSYTATLRNPLNPTTESSRAEYFKNVVLYDILPFYGDSEAVNSNPPEGDQRGPQPVPRESMWWGHLANLDSIKVIDYDGGNVNNVPKEMVDGKDATVWVGPFKRTVVDGAPRIEALSEKDLLWLYKYDSFEIYDTDWQVIDGQDDERTFTIDDIKDNAAKMEERNFVRLSDLKAYVAAHPEEELALTCRSSLERRRATPMSTLCARRPRKSSTR